MMEDDLFQMLKGAVDVLNAHGVPLVGGHSAEGAELSLALTITGTMRGMAPLAKAGLKPDQALILTKPLGTGVLLAANMRGRLPAAALAALMVSLDTSNAAAVEILVDCDATAMTDVSGFGFAGHLSEMLRASNLGADVPVAKLPSLPGALALIKDGVVSSLQVNNLQALADFNGGQGTTAALQLLADPQTAGGMLAGIPRERAAECLARLSEAGYSAACEVGTVTRNGVNLTEVQDV